MMPLGRIVEKGLKDYSLEAEVDRAKNGGSRSILI